jgi:hypothetical protein
MPKFPPNYHWKADLFWYYQISYEKYSDTKILFVHGNVVMRYGGLHLMQ